MDELGGGCNSPIGAYSFISNKKKKITGSILSLDGKKVYKNSLEMDINNDSNIGKLLAYKLIESGADKLLKNQKLNKTNIIITGEDFDYSFDELKAMEANILHYPMIYTSSVDVQIDPNPYKYIIFTSKNGVKYLSLIHI